VISIKCTFEQLSFLANVILANDFRLSDFLDSDLFNPSQNVDNKKERYQSHTTGWLLITQIVSMYQSHTAGWFYHSRNINFTLLKSSPSLESINLTQLSGINHSTREVLISHRWVVSNTREVSISCNWIDPHHTRGINLTP